MKKIKYIVILATLVCGLVVAPNSFAQRTWKNAYFTPETNSLLGGLGVFVGGDVPYSYDWSIGNRCPVPTGATTKDMVFSTKDGTWKERMRITRGGNVGIGTASPREKLHVGGSGAAIELSDPDAVDGQYTSIYVHDDGGLVLSAHSRRFDDKHLVIQQLTGNVGIGTTDPENKLHVDGAINLDPITEPDAPTSGFVLYVDSADGDLKAKSHNGAITTLALD